jgi:hypothetical protein
MRRRAGMSVKLAAAAAMLCGGLVLAVLPGCESETTVYTKRGIFEGMPGVQRGGIDPLQPVEAGGPRMDAEAELAALQTVNPDGSVTLKSPMMRHAIYHLRTQLLAEDGKLLAEQVLSKMTAERFARDGKTVYDAAEELRAQRADVLKFLSRMPNAENTPNVLVTKEGPKLFKLALVNTSAREMKFTEVFIVLEGDQWKVVWVR